MNKKSLSISELSELLNLNVNTIRKYETDFDLVVPRDELNRRYYGPNEVRLYKLIIDLKNEGLNKYKIMQHLNDSELAGKQKEKAAQLIKLETMTTGEFRDYLFKEFSRAVILREEELLQRFKEEMSEEMRETIKNELAEEMRNSMREEFLKHNEQQTTENTKLMSFIAENFRKPEGFLSKIKRFFGIGQNTS